MRVGVFLNTPTGSGQALFAEKEAERSLAAKCRIGERSGSEDPPLQGLDEVGRGRTIGNGSTGRKRLSISLLVYWMLIRTGAGIRMRRVEIERVEGVERGLMSLLRL